MSADVVLVKLGGSLITDKGEHELVRSEVLARLAGELREARAIPSCPRVLLAHGSGSFGHVAAAGTPLADRTRGDRGGDAEALRRATARTQDAAARLHRAVVASMLDAGVPTFSIAPSSFLWREGGVLCSGALEPVLGALELGLVPVGYGDVVVDREVGATICSTEELEVLLADRLAAAGRPVREALWFGQTEGVLDGDGRSIPEISEANLEAARRAAGGSSGVDVTGGMKLRLEAAWSLALRGVPSWILDGRRPGALREALTGTPRGTRVCSIRP